MIYFYCRVSTTTHGQENDRQIHVLKQKGYEVDKIYQEKMTGTKINRPVWQECYKAMQKGDTLIVESLSRIARSTKDLLDVVYDLDKKGINLISLKESVDLSTPTGRMMVGIFSVIAQFERDLTSERITEALAAKKAAGIKLGAPVQTDKRAMIREYVTDACWHGSMNRTAMELGVTPRLVKAVALEAGVLYDNIG